MYKYSVYVDGSEINQYYLTKSQALDLAYNYVDDGYKNVFVSIEKEK